MTAPDPDNMITQLSEIANSLVEAFGKLPPLLSYGGLVLVVSLAFLYLTGILPDILLIVPPAAIAAFLIYAYMEHRFELQKQDRKLQHIEAMANREQTDSRSVQEESPALTEDKEEKVAAKEWERRYLSYLLDLCQYPPSMALVDIKEAGIGGHKLALDRIFTSLEAPSRWAKVMNWQKAGELVKREPVMKTLSQPDNKKLVILGKPGSGKSTLVNYLTLCLAGDRLAGEHGAEIDVTQDHLRQYGWELGHLCLWPVRVILREYVARGLSRGQQLWEYIADDLSRPSADLAGYTAFLKNRLEHEGGLLLLDGLDEVDKASAVRQALKENIEMFARNFPRTRIVVTSRPYAYDSGWALSGFNVTQLLPFSDEQIAFFVNQWYTVMGKQDTTLGPEKAAEYSESLVWQIKQRQNLREMARHPLLLTMMVYLHRGREGGALPQRREELYRLSVTLLLDLWRRSKTIPGRETQTLAEELGMDTEQMQKALAELAFTAHHDQPTQDQTGDILGATLAGILYKHKSKESGLNLADVIEYVRDRAGLLEGHGRSLNDTDDVYRFPHRTFQEYLAAVHLLNAPDFPNELVKLAREDPARWREVVLLAGAAALPAMRWALVEALYAGRVAPVAAEAAIEADWWGAFLAGQVLTERDMHLNPPEMHREKLVRLQAWHKAILKAGVLPPRDRAVAGQVFAFLGDNRPGIGTNPNTGLPDIIWGKIVSAGTYTIGGDPGADESRKKEILISQPFQLSRYLITAAQFQAFANAEDFADSRWWAEIPASKQQLAKQTFPYANHPRENVNWYQAVAFCRWLSAKLDLQIELPHEYEWEVAARYPDGRFYPWGNTFDVEAANTAESVIRQTTAVGTYPANELGLYDLSGNVWEWCRNKYNTPDDETVDDSGDRRALRGGSWYRDQSGARAAYRGNISPDKRPASFGFRVVRRL